MLALLLHMAAMSGQTLAPPPRAQACAAPNDPDEILVCAGRDRDRYRLTPLPERYREKPALDVALTGGGSIEPRVEQGRLGDPQVKVSLKLPF